jgi:hypothetical protein
MNGKDSYFVYHGVPKSLEGSILYPLNILKDKYPEVYTKEASKYAGREHVRELEIPALDCLWNDVIHLSAIPPKDLKKALVDAGMDESVRMRFYQIDPESLNPENCIVYINNKKGGSVASEAFAPYNQEDLPNYSALKQETKDYYKERFAEGKRPLMFAYVPHIFYKGSIDISNLPIIEV